MMYPRCYLPCHASFFWCLDSSIAGNSFWFLWRSRRDSRWANSALVVSVDEHDWAHLDGHASMLPSTALQVETERCGLYSCPRIRKVAFACCDLLWQCKALRKHVLHPRTA